MEKKKVEEITKYPYFFGKVTAHPLSLNSNYLFHKGSGRLKKKRKKKVIYLDLKNMGTNELAQWYWNGF